MHMMHNYGFSWPMLLMTVFWIGLFILAIYLVIYFIDGDNKKENDPDLSMQILKERLAKGEIEVSEYEKLKLIIEENEEKN